MVAEARAPTTAHRIYEPKQPGQEHGARINYNGREHKLHQDQRSAFAKSQYDGNQTGHQTGERGGKPESDTPAGKQKKEQREEHGMAGDF